METAEILAVTFPVAFCLSEDISGSSPFLLFPSRSFLFQHIFSLSGCQMGFKRIMSSLEAGREQEETKAWVMWGVKGPHPGRGCDEEGVLQGTGGRADLSHAWPPARAGREGPRGRAPGNLGSTEVGGALSVLSSSEPQHLKYSRSPRGTGNS